MATKLEKTLAQLEALGNESVRKLHQKNGAKGELFGVKMGDIRKVAAKIKSDDELAAELWKSGNVDARLLAVLLFKPKKLAATNGLNF